MNDWQIDQLLGEALGQIEFYPSEYHFRWIDGEVEVRIRIPDIEKVSGEKGVLSFLYRLSLDELQADGFEEWFGFSVDAEVFFRVEDER